MRSKEYICSGFCLFNKKSVSEQSLERGGQGGMQTLALCSTVSLKLSTECLWRSRQMQRKSTLRVEGYMVLPAGYPQTNRKIPSNEQGDTSPLSNLAALHRWK